MPHPVQVQGGPASGASYIAGNGAIHITACTTNVYIRPSAPVYLYPAGGTASTMFSYDGGTGSFVSSQVRVASSGTSQIMMSSYQQPPRVDPEQYLRDALLSPGGQELLAAARRSPESRRRDSLRVRAMRRADTKAETTLLKLMSRPQRLTWINARYFDVQVAARTYRIREGLVGNVTLLDATGKDVKRYCCHPSIDVPLSDVAMSQWMMLLHDEAGFIAMANVLALGMQLITEDEPNIAVPNFRTPQHLENGFRAARAAGF